jgi:CelD/BcsL family acetyltransferase involved in cellulose biosynthesis
MATAPPEIAVRIETVSSESEFAGLAGSWDELVRAMPRPSPFLLHSWLLGWWRQYGGGAELAVHVAYRDERLVGALPLSVGCRFGLRVSEFVGGTWALLADVLVAPGENASVVGALAERLASSDHDFANLFGLTGSSRLVAALPADSLRLIERLEAPVLDLSGGWETVYDAKLSPKARSTRRRRKRKLETLGTVEASLARTHEGSSPRSRRHSAFMDCAGRVGTTLPASSRRPEWSSTVLRCFGSLTRTCHAC